MVSKYAITKSLNVFIFELNSYYTTTVIGTSITIINLCIKREVILIFELN